MRVLVTGANGFLGRHVVEALLGRGRTVRALVRPATSLAGLGWGERVEIARADLRAARDLAPAFEGVDAVVHLAAAVTGDEDLQFQSTVVGTERLLDAMARTPTKRIVLASSYSVYDWSAIRGELTEVSPLEADLYTRDGYAIAKVWQERIARRAAEKHGLALTVLRPGFIWGRGNENLAGIGQDSGSLHLVFGPVRRMPLTHVVNCADAFAAALDGEASVGETFNVVDDDGPTVWTYAGEWLRRSGVGGLRVPVPYWLGMGTAVAARFVSRTIYRGKGKLPGILTPCKYEARFKPLRFPNRRLRETIGWTPPLTWEQRIAATYEGDSCAAPPTEPAPGRPHAVSA